MLDRRGGGLVPRGRKQQAADQPSDEADEPVSPGDGVRGEGGGWSEVVRHRASPAGRSACWGDLSQHQPRSRRSLVLPDRREHQATVEGLPQEGRRGHEGGESVVGQAPPGLRRGQGVCLTAPDQPVDGSPRPGEAAWEG